MRTMTTRFSSAHIGVVSIVLSGFLEQACAQTAFNALTFGGGTADVGYFAPSPGWTFVPTVDLRVVAVGPVGDGIEIDFWDSTNQVIATYLSSQQNYQSNGVSYQLVDGLTLKAGFPYSISQSNVSGAYPVRFYSRTGADGYAVFSLSPFLKWGANFGVTTNNLWFPVPGPTNNVDWLYFGPTFQFQVLRQLDFREVGANVVFSWPTQSVSYAVQQNSGFNTTNWVTLTNTPAVVGSENQVTIPKPNGTMFYRLTSQ
jgi:hypothetical protein